MKYLVILAAVLAMAFCVNADCNALAREKVKTQWSIAYHHNRNDFGKAVWRAFFKIRPEDRAMFSRVNGDDVSSPAFMAHSARVLGGLDMVISILDREDILASALAHLKGQHIERHVTRASFKGFRQALSEVVPALLGRCFDKDAWAGCIDHIAQGIFDH